MSGCDAQWATSGKLPGKLGATTRTRWLVHPRYNQFELSYAHESWLGLTSMQISFVSSEESHFAGTYLGLSRALGTLGNPHRPLALKSRKCQYFVILAHSHMHGTLQMAHRLVS